MWSLSTEQTEQIAESKLEHYARKGISETENGQALCIGIITIGFFDLYLIG